MSAVKILECRNICGHHVTEHFRVIALLNVGVQSLKDLGGERRQNRRFKAFLLEFKF